ncbi:MAG: HAMP domain-containing histidine kinase [Candidatus Aureabacteria bacterium]|nr:HAMP domain-containing histidine kinase [Candidatus Auribacterota bacterium]
MKIRGKLILAAATSILFMLFIFYTYLFVFVSQATYQKKQSIADLSSTYLKVMKQLGRSFDNLTADGVVDSKIKRTLDILFPKGWAVINKDNIIIVEKNINALKLLENIKTVFKRKEISYDADSLTGKGKVIIVLDEESGISFMGILPFSLLGAEDFKGLFRGLTAIFLIGAAGVGFIIYITASKFVIRPMERISDAAYRISCGDYEHEINVKETFDEGQRLAESVNDMMVQLKEYHDEMQGKINKVYEDNLRQKKNLILAQRLAATGKLAAGIAHEINNPLGGMLNAVKVLREESTGEKKKTQDYIELVEDGLTRIRATVRKILLFQQSDKSLTPQDVVLAVPIKKAIDFISHRINEKNVEVVFPSFEDMPSIAGNRMELQQVFLNIFMNSVDAVENKGKIIICWEVIDKKIIIEINDNGCGMKDEELGQIFDLFYTTKAAGEGTGLGLSIVYNVIKNHGGEIEIGSVKGEGTKVRLIFPIIKSNVFKIN